MVGSPAHRLAERNTDSHNSSAMVQGVQVRFADPIQNKTETGFKLGFGQQHPNYQAITCVCVWLFFVPMTDFPCKHIVQE